MRFDRKGLKFKLWLYFVLFAVLLMLLLWFFQIVFLQTYYQAMKTREIMRISDTIAKDYLQMEDSSFSEMIIRNDIYIHIENEKGEVLFQPEGNFQRPIMGIQPFDIVRLKTELQNGDSNSVSRQISLQPGNMELIIHGRIIERDEGGNLYLILFSPLTPVQSTVKILARQLVFVTVISLFLTFVLSFFISKKLAKPLVRITASAEKLAQGQYGTTFEEGSYTEVKQLAKTLNYTSKELKKTENLRKDLVANVSHDLRTPLTMVKTYAEMIRDISGEQPEKRNQHLQVIIDEADRLNRLVGDLLILSKIQAGVYPLEKSSFNLDEAVQGILNTYAILTEQGGYTFVFSGSGEIWVDGDAVRMEQVISNLISNAVRYCGEDKRIVVKLSETRGWARCEVTDFGPGISEDQQKYIWERYNQASSNAARSISGGSGLGLSIVKEILMLHQARFGVESRQGEGSTFWFEIETSKSRDL